MPRRYRVDSLRPPGDIAFMAAGAIWMDATGDAFTAGSATGPGRPDTISGEVAGVPEELERLFRDKVFTEQELAGLGARKKGGRWTYRYQGTDYELELIEER